MTMHDQIQLMIDKFHRKVAKDEKIRTEVQKFYKSINIDLETEAYSMILDHGEIKDFKDELLPEADVTIITTPENLQALIEGTLRPMKAYITKKIAIKGKIDDLMALKNMF